MADDRHYYKVGRDPADQFPTGRNVIDQPGALQPLHYADGRGRGSICTVAVIPAASTTPSVTSSMWTRTGIRYARLTQVRIGLTLASPCPSGCALATLMPRAMLST
jgi:hypothetical protein